MENFDVIMQSIGSVGFPITITLIMLATINRMNESHKNELSDLQKAIENNTLAITRLMDKMGANED